MSAIKKKSSKSSRAVKLNDEQRRLVEENIKLVGYVIGKMCNIPKHMVEDAIHEGYLALCRAALSYDKDAGGVCFSTYACVVIARHIYAFVKKNVLHELRNAEYSSQMYEKTKGWYTDRSLDSVIDIVSRSENDKAFATFCALRLQGYTISQIAERMGVKPDYLSRLIMSWKRHLLNAEIE